MIITKDIVGGHEYTEDDRSGGLTRHWRVDGLLSSSQITDDALFASDGVLITPKAGERHETMPDLVVRRVQVRPCGNSRTSVNIYIDYVKVRRRLLDMRLSGVTYNGSTNLDKFGKIIYVGYKGPSTVGGTVTSAGTAFPAPNPSQPGSGGWAYDYAPEVPFPLSQDTLEIVYLENASPNAKIKKFRRKLNSQAWQGGEPREWFCEAITAQIESAIPKNAADLPDPKIVTGPAVFDWIVTYRFIRRDKPTVNGDRVNGVGWDPLLIFRDISTGLRPNDIDPREGGWPEKKKGNGWNVPEILGEEDFNELDLVRCDI